MPGWPGNAPPNNLIIVSTESWRWLTDGLISVHQDVLNIQQNLEGIRILMASTNQDLIDRLDQLKAIEQSDSSALVTLGTALNDIVSKFNNLPPAGVLTQVELDAAVAEATEIAAAATTNAANLAAAAGKAVEADTPTTPTV